MSLLSVFRVKRWNGVAVLLSVGVCLLLAALVSLGSLIGSGMPGNALDDTLESVNAAELGSEQVESLAANPPAVTVLPDFTQVADTQMRKQKFFDYLEDYVARQNKRTKDLRRQVISYAEISESDFTLSPAEQERLTSLARRYRVKISTAQASSSELTLQAQAQIIDALLLRVDAIPVSLVLAQAANESAWGTSRFAIDGNNLFGQWCYEQGCGFVPYERGDDANHEVKRFETVDAAVAAYFRNINTHPSYSHFRRMRARMREQERSLDPIQLAYGLGSYSQRGDYYIDEVQTIIQQNDLQHRDEG